MKSVHDVACIRNTFIEKRFQHARSVARPSIVDEQTTLAASNDKQIGLQLIAAFKTAIYLHCLAHDGLADLRLWSANQGPGFPL